MSSKLQPFPGGSSQLIGTELNVEVNIKEQKLTAQFELTSPSTVLILPSTSARKSELWQNTCFELFFKSPNEPHYWEVNFRPTGDWNIYAFDSYRSGMRQELAVDSIQLNRFEQSQEKCVSAFTFDLSGLRLKGKIKLGITAVIEEKNGNKSYWALTHCGEQPNFHLAESFLAELLV